MSIDSMPEGKKSDDNPNSGSRDRLIPLVLIFLCLFASLWYPLNRFWPYFEGRICAENDLSEYYLPLYVFDSHALKDGDTTFWNPLYACGFNILGEGQYALLHPMRQLCFAFLNVNLILMLDVVLPTLIFQAGFYVLCRRMGASVPVALACSYFTAFSSSINARHFHLYYLYMLAHSPWLMVCFLSYVKSTGSSRKIFLLVLIAGLKCSQLLFGHPPCMLYTSLLESSFLLMLFFNSRHRRFPIELPISYLAGMMMAFPQIWSIFMESRNSIRTSKDGLDYLSFSLGPYGILNLFQAFNPFIVSSSFPGDAYDAYERFVCSAGSALALCTLGTFRTTKDSGFRKWALVVFLAAMFMSYLTMIPVINEIYDAVPLIGKFRINQRYGSLAISALGIYLAMALENLRTGELEIDRKRRILGFSYWAALIAMSAVTPVFCLVAFARFPFLPGSIRDYLVRLALAFSPVQWQLLGVGFMSISTGILLSRKIDRNRKVHALCMMLILQTFCLAASFSKSKYMSYADVEKTFDPTIAKSSESRDVFVERLEPGKGQRLATTNPMTSDTLFVNGYYTLLPPNYFEDQTESLLRISAVRRVFLRKSESYDVSSHELPEIKLTEIELDRPLPRFRLVSNSVISTLPESKLDDYDLSSTLILPEGPEIRSSSEGELKTVRIRNGEKSFSVRTNEAQFLVVADRWHSGWTCRIDNIPAEIHKAYGRFQAVLVPRGEHRIEMKFEPRTLRQGIYVSVLGLGLLMTACLSVSRRNTVSSDPSIG